MQETMKRGRPRKEEVVEDIKQIVKAVDEDEDIDEIEYDEEHLDEPTIQPKPFKEKLYAKIVKIPTQHSTGIQLDSGEVVTLEEFFVEMYNELKKLSERI